MLKKLAIPACLTAALFTMGGQVEGQTGPVREGVRRTGEAAIQGGRAVVQGSREAIGRAGQATRDAVGSTTEAARAQVDRLERSELQVGSGAVANDSGYGSINANAQVGPAQIQAGADMDPNQQQLRAGGQYQGNLDDPNMQGRYESGYRGVDGQYQSDQPFGGQGGVYQQSGQVSYGNRAYLLRHDQYGREFICVGGRPVYFDNQGSQGQQREAYKLSDEQMRMQGGQQYQDNRMYQGSGQFQQDQYRQNNMLDNSRLQQGGYGPSPAPPARLNAETDFDAANQNQDATIRSEQRTDLNESSSIDAESRSSADLNRDSDSESSEIDLDSQQDADASVDTDNQSRDADGLFDDNRDSDSRASESNNASEENDNEND